MCNYIGQRQLRDLSRSLDCVESVQFLREGDRGLGSLAVPGFQVAELLLGFRLAHAADRRGLCGRPARGGGASGFWCALRRGGGGGR